MPKAIIKHNLNHDEYVETLEKALKQATNHSEGPHATLEDPLAQEVRDRAYKAYEQIQNNMVKEIEKVVNEN